MSYSNRKRVYDVHTGVKIGKWCIIGAGSIVIKDVLDGVKVVGNPGDFCKQDSLMSMKIFTKPYLFRVK